MLGGRSIALIFWLVCMWVVFTSCSNANEPLEKNPPIRFSPYAEPAWHPDGRVITFNHIPLARQYRHPPTKQYVYEYADTAAGYLGCER
jgi:hypothetical protein